MPDARIGVGGEGPKGEDEKGDNGGEARQARESDIYKVRQGEEDAEGGEVEESVGGEELEAGGEKLKCGQDKDDVPKQAETEKGQAFSGKDDECEQRKGSEQP